MQIHNLKRNIKNKKSVQVGRGGKRGKTSGKGTKGQKARAGRKLRPEERDIIKKIPKLRGYRFKSIQVPTISINLSKIEAHFKDGDTVSVASLVEKRLVRTVGGKMPKVKILSTGEVTKKITIENLPASASAKAKIEKAGGKFA
jgi:large subunit ribosomal protein L15